MQDDWQDDIDDESFDYEAGEEPVSKSQIKRDLDALKDLGRDLIALSPAELTKLDLDEQLLDAVVLAQGLQKGALKRQTGFIGGLIAKRDHEAISKQLEILKQPHREDTLKLHQLEEWRDRLLAGEAEVMTQLHHQFAEFDGQHVRQLVRNAKREVQQNQPPKSARLLFKYLQQLSD
ncbi:MAG: ribosome biogenesis factor YjgA [Methylophaga sp.]|nr:ribosome biogenesis factor YjgA [Methylophaga sp.]